MQTRDGRGKSAPPKPSPPTLIGLKRFNEFIEGTSNNDEI